MKIQFNKEASELVFKEDGPTFEDLIIYITNNVLINKIFFEIDSNNKDDISSHTRDR